MESFTYRCNWSSFIPTPFHCSLTKQVFFITKFIHNFFFTKNFFASCSGNAIYLSVDRRVREQSYKLLWMLLVEFFVHMQYIRHATGVFECSNCAQAFQ